MSESEAVPLIRLERPPWLKGCESPKTSGLIRRLCVSSLKREPSKLSLKMKRYTAAMDNSFLLKILAASGRV